MLDELTVKFLQFRTGTTVLSGGQGIGDLMIFIGRHDTVQHSCILVWLDIPSMLEHKVKVHPRFVDEETTALSFLGLAEGARIDMVMGDKRKGLILWEPEELLANAPVVYTRGLNEKYISDEYVSRKMQEYIELHHLKMTYAYGKLHIVTAGLGFDVFGPHKDGGKLCSENIYMFLEHLCKYPEFSIEDTLDTKTNTIEFDDYKVPDAVQHLYVPDFYLSSHNTHPVFEPEEYRVIAKQNEEDITVKHPFFVMFVVLIILIVFFFVLINNYCESCNRTGFCPIGSKDIFDIVI